MSDIMVKISNKFDATNIKMPSSMKKGWEQNTDYFPSGNNQGNQVKLSPAAIMYLFPEFFSRKPRFGGFKSPCNNVKVKHNELFYSMFIGTLAVMEYRKLIRFYKYKKGFLIKSSKLGVLKNSMFDPIEYGYLARRIARLQVGQTISIYGALKVDVETVVPEKYFINQVFKYDLTGKGLFYDDDSNRPICDRIYFYRGKVSELSKLLQSFAFYRKDEYKMIIKEIRQVFTDMKPEEEEDDWD